MVRKDKIPIFYSLCRQRVIACFLSLFGMIWMISSCTEEIEWELKYEKELILVVEGKITNEMKAHEVKLTKPVYEMNATPEPVSDALVEIVDNRGIVHSLQEERTRPGIYHTSSDFTAVANKGYMLRIRYMDRTITAITFMNGVTPFQQMVPFTVQVDPKLYEVYISDSDEPAIVRLELDWSHVRGYDTLPETENHALIYHYTMGSVDVNHLFAPPREPVKFPPGTLVFREKESVSGAYERFLRGILSETDWRGGVFDVLPGNAQTNLSEGAIGYFTAATVIRDTVVIP